MCTPYWAAVKSAIVTTRAGSPAIAMSSGRAPPAQSKTALTPFGASALTRFSSPSPYVVGSAPRERRKSWLRSLAVPMTAAPRATASWMATVPTPPAAPWISTMSPGRTLSRSRTRVDVSTLPAAPPASSQLQTAGFGAQAASTTKSAFAVRRVIPANPKTSSPTCTPSTPSPISSTTPAASKPVRYGKVTGTNSRYRPLRIAVSPGDNPEAFAAIRISPGPACGSATSATRRTLGGPYSLNSIALMPRT
jgi:hypothetical protein